MDTKTVQVPQEKSKAPLLNNTLLLFMLAMVLANTASHMYDPLLPLYLKDLNATVTQIGLFSTSLGVVSLPAPAIGGQIWNRFGPQAPFRITAWLSLLATVPVWRKFKLPDNGKEEE